MSDDPDPILEPFFDAAREDAPPPELLASVEAELGPLLDGPSGGPGGATGGFGPALAGGVVAAAAAVVLYFVFAGGDPPEPTAPPDPVEAAAPVETPAPAPVLEPSEPEPAAPEITGDQAASTEPSTPRPPSPEPARAEPAEELDEVQLLFEARQALSNAPERTLALARQHQRHFPEGALREEREVLAIEALVAIGRRESAARRAERFRERFPRSTHRRRLHHVLGEVEAP